MNTKRDELIKSALMNIISGGFDVYTAEDILIVAGITEEEREEFRAKIDNDIASLAAKKKKE